MTEDNLGYMSFDRWKELPADQRDYYLWDAMVNRCKACGAVKGSAWKYVHMGIVAVSAFLGGMFAQILGIAKHWSG